MPDAALSVQDDLHAARTRWLAWLGGERRVAPLTVAAYERDTRQFLSFLARHCGGSNGCAK